RRLMGMSMPSRSGGRRGPHRAPVSEINVTPLVDVMLVLLIVFMVTAPLLTAGVALELPQTAAPEMQTEAKPLTLSLDAAGLLYLGEDAVPRESLLAAVGAAAGDAGTDQRIYIRADRTADYGVIMEIMGALAGAGYARIGLITEHAGEG